MKRLLLFIFLLSSVFSAMAESADSTYNKDPYFVKLLKTKSLVPIFYNEQVKKQINFYVRNLNNQTALLIGKTLYYNSLYGEQFDAAGIPRQLFLAASANSNCDPLYTDQDGGSGMWSLSYAIAKKYTLTTNSYVDERRDPVAGTKAAIAYFKDLQLIYQDWLKTIVAFRCGPINMNMAIHKANNSLDYANIHNMLAAEHQTAAVNFMAFWYIMNFYQEYKIVPVKYKLPETDTVHVQSEIRLNAIALNLNISEEVLKLCNAELRLEIVPVSYNSKGLRLPKEKVADYHNKINIIFPPTYVSGDSSLNDSFIMDNNSLLVKRVNLRDSINTDDDDEEDSPKAQKKEPSTVTIIYVVKKGDGLLLIADLFDCRLSDLRKWNGMKKDRIYVGQKLKVKVPKNKVSQYKKINSMTMAQKKKLAARS